MVFQTPTKEQKNEIRKLKKSLTRTKDGTVSSTIGNYVAILTGDPRLKGAIRLNELSGRAQIVRDLGWNRNPDEPVTDTDVNFLRLWIDREYGISSEKLLSAAIDIVAHEDPFHPIRDKLNSLVHDGVSRIPYVLHHFLGARDRMAPGGHRPGVPSRDQGGPHALPHRRPGRGEVLVLPAHGHEG